MAHSRESRRQNASPIVVGVGASAGGLEAISSFLSYLPAKPGAAIVVVMHLSPDYPSDLAKLLARASSVPVQQIEDATAIEPDHVYVIPPNTNLAVMNGVLQLIPRNDGHPWLPIDYFFRTLSSDAESRAIGVVLSGTGSDGALGLEAIRTQLGLTMAQKPDTAEFPGMPEAAIEHGSVDYVAAPEDLAKEIVNHVTHFGRRELPYDRPEQSRNQISKIFVILRSATGHDFSAFKENTVRRRVQRRLDLHKIERLEDYVRYLHRNPQEAHMLHRELLIGVTEFFREPEAFETLKNTVLPELLRDRESEQPFRVWVPGCSSGEEAYSLAMVIREVLEEHELTTAVNIFATDIDEEAIDRARRGVFPAAVKADVGEERTKRFFKHVGDALQVVQSIRGMIIFSKQDLISDPPFTRLDLLSCRNLLIYLKPEIQQRLIPLFHYSLRDGGYLVLGSSETVGNFADLFQKISTDTRIYKARADDGSAMARTNLQFPVGGESPATDSRRVKHEPTPTAPEHMLHRFLLNEHTPPAVFVNRRREIVYVHGRTGRYFELPTGVARMDVVDMVRSGLTLPLSQALREAFKEEQVVKRSGLRLDEGDTPTFIELSVEPVKTETGEVELFAVVIREEPRPTAASGQASAGGEAGDEKSAEKTTYSAEEVQSLEQELESTRERLQTTVEELESTNEELKSSLEEYQSTNEELQSSNEELESSKEEMQSLNEELNTVNSELQTKNAELSRSNAEMKNFLDSLEIPILFVDNQLRIKRFTRAVGDIINIIESDIHRHIKQFTHKLDYDEFINDIADVARRTHPIERVVNTHDGRTLRVDMAPYRNVDDVFEGVLITFLELRENSDT
ncbi:MAG: CheR family methyltransferase [Spirochaetota bacterium]